LLYIDLSYSSFNQTKERRGFNMAKTMTFAVMHFSIAFSVAYLITGSLLVGGLVAIVEPAINTVAFYFHEIIWNKVQQADVASELSKTIQAAGENYALRSM
jgi:uncharacterized membrane protein